MLNLVQQSDRETLDCGIYKIIDIRNGKIYIGSSYRLKYRFYSHNRELKLNNHRNKILQRIYNKYGNIFKFEIIEYCNKENLTEREQYWMDALKPEYNLLPTAGNNSGFKHSDETKIKMSIAHKGKTASKETREKQRQAKLGKSQTLKSRLKRSVSSKGRIHTPEAIAKMSLSKKGKSVSIEQKEKLAKLRVGSKHSEKTKAKMRAARLGRKFPRLRIENDKFISSGG